MDEKYSFATLMPQVNPSAETFKAREEAAPLLGEALVAAPLRRPEPKGGARAGAETPSGSFIQATSAQHVFGLKVRA